MWRQTQASVVSSVKENSQIDLDGVCAKVGEFGVGAAQGRAAACSRSAVCGAGDVQDAMRQQGFLGLTNHPLSFALPIPTSW